jgi:hypothetical protein
LGVTAALIVMRMLPGVPPERIPQDPEQAAAPPTPPH